MTNESTFVARSLPRKLRLSDRPSARPTMRTVRRASRSSAALAHRRSCAREGSLRDATAYCTVNLTAPFMDGWQAAWRKSLRQRNRANPHRSRAAGPLILDPGAPRLGLAGRGALLVDLVGIDDALNQGMTHYVFGIEIGKRDAADVFQHIFGLDQAALLAAREIDLGYVAIDDGLAAEPDARQEHLHLLGRRILRFIEDHERVIERASAHEREGGDLDGAALEQLGHLVVAHEIVERVVERAQVRIYLRRHVAGQKAEPLSRFNRRAHQDDALDPFALQGVHRTRHGEVGLACPRGADAERQVVREDVLEVLNLPRRASVQVMAAGHQRRAAFGGLSVPGPGRLDEP